MSSNRLWDKGVSLDEQILKFTVGSDYLLDARLLPFDVIASAAHAKMLQKMGYLRSDELEKLLAALDEIDTEFSQGKWQITLEQEDCHTAIEQKLTEKLGDLGGKIHLGRSRNDQVLTAIRLYLRSEIASILNLKSKVEAALLILASEQGDIEIPGYTHTQQAMPSSVELWAEAFASEMRSCDVLLNAADELASECPLGSAAGYGTPGLQLDREFTAELLGFSCPQEPVTAVQLSRGRAESALAFAIVQILGIVGRMSADVCLFASQEFGFLKLADDISTGSSIMPQKRNPDVFELLRAQVSQAAADFQAILSLTFGLSSGYHRDLQLMKEPLFRIIDRARASLAISAHAISRITFDPVRAKEVTSPEIHAAERAFALVQQEGISFREAYKRVGEKG